MTDRLEWFPCYPTKLLGALAAMAPNEQVVYFTVLLRIYEVNGPCRDGVDALSIRTGVSRRNVQAAIETLVGVGRLVKTDAGLHNPVAETVLAESIALRKRRQIAGASGGITKAKKIKENQTKAPSRATPKLQPGSTPLPLQEQRKGEGKDSPLPPKTDGWPDDYVEQFWANFPPYRRESKRKVGEKLAKLREAKVVAWDVLFGAVLKFAATNPGEYAPAPLVWLNQERWDREYGGSNGRIDNRRSSGAVADPILAAARRRMGPGSAGTGGLAGQDASLSPVTGGHNPGPDQGGGSQRGYDLDLNAEPAGAVRRSTW